MPADQVDPGADRSGRRPRTEPDAGAEHAVPRRGQGRLRRPTSSTSPGRSRSTAATPRSSTTARTGRRRDTRTPRPATSSTVGTPNTPVQVTLTRTAQGWKVAEADLVTGGNLHPRKGLVSGTCAPERWRTYWPPLWWSQPRQGVIVAGSAAACDNPRLPDCPAVTVTPGSGPSASVPRHPARRGPTGQRAVRHRWLRRLRGLGWQGGKSGAAPVANTSGGAPAPPPAYVITCGPAGSS